MTKIVVHDLALPDSFREAFFEQLGQVVKRSESAMLVGPAGMGKTLALDFLEQPKIQKKHFANFQIAFFRFNLSEVTAKEIKERIVFDPTRQQKLIMVADNAEALDLNSGKSLLQALKDIREQFRPQTTIILCAERNMLTSPVFSDNSSLRSIFLENVIFLLPLNKKDTKDFGKAIAEQMALEIKPDDLEKISDFSGGSPRIIKRLIKLAGTNQDFFQKVLANPKIDDKLWFDMESLRIFSQTNKAYDFVGPQTPPAKTQNAGENICGVHFSTPLTKQEHLLATLLLERQGQLVTREEMVETIWKNKQYEVNEHALDQMLHRLKKRLKSTSPICTLQTLRGRGVTLKI